MNKITNAEIFDTLNLKLDEANINSDRILGIFAYGSVELDIAETIEDIKATILYLPTFRELCVDEVKYKDLENVLDIRRAIASPNFIMSILNNKYKIVNKKYEELFDKYLTKTEVKSVNDGIEAIMRLATQEQVKKEVRLTETEKVAYQKLLEELGETKEGNISISQLIDKTSFSRPVYTSLLQKISDCGKAEVIKQGVKGTYIKILE